MASTRRSCVRCSSDGDEAAPPGAIGAHRGVAAAPRLTATPSRAFVPPAEPAGVQRQSLPGSFVGHSSSVSQTSDVDVDDSPVASFGWAAAIEAVPEPSTLTRTLEKSASAVARL